MNYSPGHCKIEVVGICIKFSKIDLPSGLIKLFKNSNFTQLSKIIGKIYNVQTKKKNIYIMFLLNAPFL